MDVIALFLTGFAANGIVPILISAVSRLEGLPYSCFGTAGGVTATMQLGGSVLIPTYIITPAAGNNYYLYFILCGIAAMLSAIFILLLPQGRNIKAEEGVIS